MVVTQAPVSHFVPEPASPSSPFADGASRPVVLVVDDEELIRRAVRRVLERAGYEVREAPDGRAALSLLETDGNGIALVLSDVVMPVMDGVVLARTLRERLPALPIVFTSGHTQRALSGGSTLPADIPLLRKPWTVDELLAFVRAALER